MKIVVEHLDGSFMGRRLELGQDRIRFGRAPGNEVQFHPTKDLTVSSTHAELQRSGDQIRIQDLGSTHGLFLNGQKVQSSLLTSGDILAFGEKGPKVRIQIQDKGQAAAKGEKAPAKSKGRGMLWLGAAAIVLLVVVGAFAFRTPPTPEPAQVQGKSGPVPQNSGEQESQSALMGFLRGLGSGRQRPAPAAAETKAAEKPAEPAKPPEPAPPVPAATTAPVNPPAAAAPAPPPAPATGTVIANAEERRWKRLALIKRKVNEGMAEDKARELAMKEYPDPK